MIIMSDKESMSRTNLDLQRDNFEATKEAALMLILQSIRIKHDVIGIFMKNRDQLECSLGNTQYKFT